MRTKKEILEEFNEVQIENATFRDEIKTIEDKVGYYLNKIDEALEGYCYADDNFPDIKELIQDLKKELGL